MQLPEPWDTGLKVVVVIFGGGLATWVYKLWRHAIRPIQKEVEDVKADLKEVKQTAQLADERLADQVDTVKNELRKQDTDIRTAQTSMIKDTMRNEEEIKRTDSKVGKVDDDLDKTKDKVAEIDKELHGTMKEVEHLKERRDRKE